MAGALATVMVVLCLGGMSGCSMGKSKQVAEQAVEQVHRQLDAEQFDRIYADAGDEFRKAGKAEDAQAYFAAIHKKLGNVKAAHETGYFVNTTLSGTTARVQYDSEFAEGKAAESFVFSVRGEQATLVGYNINSPTLITK